MRFTYRVSPDAKNAAEDCAAHVESCLRAAIDARAQATFAISGGTTPRFMFAQFAASSIPWDRVHLFWVDERAVPPTDPESNYKLAAETLLSPANVPERNIHRVRAEMEPAAAALAYEQEIRSFFGLRSGDVPEFDVIHRGMGADAHTASLFPGDPLVDDRDGLCAATLVAKKQQWRITLLPAVLMRARNTVMLVTGEDKAEPLHEVLEAPADYKRYPVQIAPPDGNGVVWFLDEAAARGIHQGRMGA